MKRKVLPTPAEAKAETFSEKYDDPTARPTTSFESGNPMRKGCANKNKDDYILYYQAFETSDPTRLFAACAMHENKRPDFEIRPFPSPTTSATNDSVELPGLEPGTTEPKSAVLPLHHSSIRCSKAGAKVRQRIEISKNPPRMVSLRKISTKK